MKDIMEILRKAECKRVFENQKEFWAVLTQMQLADGIVCMMNARLRLAFIREKYNYDLDEWSVNIDYLKKEIPQIYWHACEDAVNAECFSLNDFYFATV